MLRDLVGALEPIDRGLRTFAGIIGFDIPNPFLRYAAVFLIYAAIVAASFLFDSYIAALSLAVGFIGIAAGARLWAWRRAQIQQAIIESDDLAATVRDRGNDGFVTAALLLLLSPILFFRVGLQPGAFSLPEAYDPLTATPWVLLTLGELAKAVPILDYSEAYGVENFSGIVATTFAAQSAIFLTRALDDFVLLNALFAYVQQAGARERAQTMISQRTPDFELLLHRIKQFAFTFSGIPLVAPPQSFITATRRLRVIRNPIRRASYYVAMVCLPAANLRRPARRQRRHYSLLADWEMRRSRERIAALIEMMDRDIRGRNSPQFLQVAATNARVDLYRWALSQSLPSRYSFDPYSEHIGTVVRRQMTTQLRRLGEELSPDSSATDFYELGLLWSHQELESALHMHPGELICIEPFSAADKIEHILSAKLRLTEDQAPRRDELSAGLTDEEEILISAAIFALVSAIQTPWRVGTLDRGPERLERLITALSERHRLSTRLQQIIARRVKGVVRNVRFEEE